MRSSTLTKFGLAVAIIFTGFSNLNAKEKKIDVLKVNNVLTKIVTEVVNSQTFINSMEISLDAEKSDIENNIVFLIAKAGASHSLWSQKQTSLHMNSDISIVNSTDTHANKWEASANFNIGIQTDVTALINYYLKDITKDFCDSSKDYKHDGYVSWDQFSREFACKHYANKEFENTADMVEFVLEMFEDIKDLGQKYKEDFAPIYLEKFPKLKSRIERDLVDIERETTQFEKELRIEKVGADYIVNFDYDAEHSTTEPITVTLTINDSFLNFKINTKYKTSQNITPYLNFVKSYLYKLEAKDEKTIKEMTTLAKYYAKFVASVLTKN